MQSDQLLLGVDGGGSKTVAWIALSSHDGQPRVVGRGLSAGSNPQAVGFAAALANLEEAIRLAREEAGQQERPFDVAVLALAGSDRPENRRVFEKWLVEELAVPRFRIVHDALPVLAAGTSDGWGVALISGTGSLAFGQAADGRQARSGGWGYLFGDEGSGYAIAAAGLRAVARANDGRGPSTPLTEAMLERLQLDGVQRLVTAVYGSDDPRATIASLAPVVVNAAEQGDAAAGEILDVAASELAEMVASVARRLDFAQGRFPLCLAGRLLVDPCPLRVRLAARMAWLDLEPTITVVPEPVAGAVRLAAR